MERTATFVKAAISPLSFITPSGINHPYYGYTPSTFVPIPGMFARITSFPALGHEYVVPYVQESISFNVLIETESQHLSLEVQIWHNLRNTTSWEPLTLSRAKSPRLTVVQSQPRLHRNWFKGSLNGKSEHLRSVSFTVRFRTSSSESWKWAHDQSGVDDGQLVFQPPLKTVLDRTDLTFYVNGLSTDVKVARVRSETPDTILWSLTASAAGARGDESGFTHHSFGLPSNYTRWFALVRLWSPWLAPRHGRGSKLADKSAVLYSFLRHDGLHVVVLAISGIDDVLTVLKTRDNGIDIHARNDREEEGVARVIVAVAPSFEQGIAACMYQARHIVNDHTVLSEEERQAIQQINELAARSQQEEDGVKANWVQDWYDGFTYCTWNGLGQNLTEEKISGALSSLEKNGIKITNLIIDDNWQSLDHEGEGQMIRGWKDFSANPKGFPEGLGTAISRIRKKYPAIQHVAVWHAILGYWGGISPEGELAKRYRTRTVNKDPNVIDVGDNKMLVIDAPDVKRMYDDFYAFLNKSGIDSVKTDAQFMIDEISNASARRDLTNIYYNTWISAQLRHFGGLAISCMSQTPTILFRCQLPTNLPAYPTRNSDDFFPDVEESHPWHIFCNAHNSLFTKHLNVLPDWDMFQTSHPFAAFHAASRALSGGPIYITDTPGHHDVSLISQMTAQTIREQTVILRPSVVGRSAQAYIGFEEERLVKLATYNGRREDGTSWMGFFNCRKEGVTEVVSLEEFLGVEGWSAGKGMVLRSHSTGACSGVVTAEDVFAVQVEGNGWEIMSANPVFDASPVKQGLHAADLGLVGKMTGGAAIVDTKWDIRGASDTNGSAHANGASDHVATYRSNGNTTNSKTLTIKTSLKALGTWGIWLSCSPDSISIDDNVMVLLEKRAVPRECVTLACGKGIEERGEGGQGVVLQVDVERAWRELELKAGWGNEVTVEAFVRL